MNLKKDVVAAMELRLTGTRLERSEDAVVLTFAADAAEGYDRSMTVIIPFAHVPTRAPAGDSTADNIATWMFRDLGEEFDLKSEASYFLLREDGTFIGLREAARDPV